MLSYVPIARVPMDCGLILAGIVDRAAGQLIAVTLTNTHGAQAAAFKFRTNAPNRYTVKPVMGVIPLGGSTTIQCTERWTGVGVGEKDRGRGRGEGHE